MSAGFDLAANGATIGAMKKMSLSAECPKCGQDRRQEDYEPDELVQLLRTGAPIEAHCANCEEYWELSTEDRADLARALNKA